MAAKLLLFFDMCKFLAGFLSKLCVLSVVWVGLFGLFELAEEACADEGIEAEVLLALAGFGIDGCIGFGLVQLGIEAGLPVLERGKFFGSGRCSIMGGGISLVAEGCAWSRHWLA